MPASKKFSHLSPLSEFLCFLFSNGGFRDTRARHVKLEESNEDERRRAWRCAGTTQWRKSKMFFFLSLFEKVIKASVDSCSHSRFPHFSLSRTSPSFQVIKKTTVFFSLHTVRGTETEKTIRGKNETALKKIINSQHSFLLSSSFSHLHFLSLSLITNKSSPPRSPRRSPWPSSGPPPAPRQSSRNAASRCPPPEPLLLFGER